jgi:hypothetical protein
MVRSPSKRRFLGDLGSPAHVDLQHFDEFLMHEQRGGGWRYQRADAVLARYSTWLLDVYHVAVQLGPKEMSAALKKREDCIVVDQPNKRLAPLFNLPPSERGAAETEPPERGAAETEPPERGAAETESPERGADPMTEPPAPRSLQGAAKFFQDASTNKGPHQVIAALKGTVVTLKKIDKVDLRRQVAEAKNETKKETKKETEKEAEASTSYFSRELKPCFSIIRS